MMQSLPDLSLRLAGIPGTAYHAFNRDGLIVAVPDRLRLEAEPDGTPRLLLTLIRGGGTATTTGGRFELGLSIEAGLEEIGRAIAAQEIPASLIVADFEHAVLTISARLGPIAPTQLAPPLVLPPDLLTRARVVVELTAEAASIASQIMEDATLPVEAMMSVAFRAVAARIPLSVSFNPRAVAERLGERIVERVGQVEVISTDVFESLIDSLLAGPEIVAEGDLHAIDPVLRAQTVALRLRDRFAVRGESDSAGLKLIPPAEIPSGQERFDFSEPAAVLVEQSISLDPLSTARAMRNGTISDLVRRIEVPPVPTGRQRITVSANLPEPVAGLQTLVADVRAPALPPFRPFPVFASTSLDSPDRVGEVELTLSPGEPLDLQVRLRAIVASNNQAAEIAGAWRSLKRSAVLLGPSDFGKPLLVMRASASLTSLAVVDALSESVLVARLDATTPMMSIPLTSEITAIIVRPLGEGRTIEIPLEGRKRLDLDITTLPGFGAHRARFTTASAKPIMVEWRPEASEEEVLQAVRMGPDRPVVDIGWIAFSPFRPGMVWRVILDGTPGVWSQPVQPQENLLIEVTGRNSMDAPRKSFVIDGIELTATDDTARRWTYIPVRPALETNDQGTPIFQVIEAGSIAFLQCTARVALNESERSSLLARLKEKEPKAETLEAAALSVQRLALEIKAGNGWSALAESKGSGMPPWTAAFSLTLGPDALATLKSAAAGEKDRARLVARIVLQGSPSSFRRSETTRTSRVEAPGGSSSESFTSSTDASTSGTQPESRELVVDLSDCFSQRGVHH